MCVVIVFQICAIVHAPEPNACSSRKSKIKAALNKFSPSEMFACSWSLAFPVVVIEGCLGGLITASYGHISAGKHSV